jgi:hypothetical protein
MWESTNLNTSSNSKIKTPPMDQVILQCQKLYNYNLLSALRIIKQLISGNLLKWLGLTIQPESYATHNAMLLVRRLGP